MDEFVVDVRHKDDVFFSGLPADETGCSVLRIGYERWGPRLRVRREHLGHQVLVYVVSGEGDYRVPDRAWRLGPGMVFCAGPGSPHAFSCDPDNPLEVYILWMVGRKATAVVRDHLGASNLAVQVDNPTEVTAMMAFMLSVAKSGTALAQEVSNRSVPVLLLTIRGGVLSSAAHADAALHTYLRCRTFIDRHAGEMRSAAEAAVACGVSQAHMCRLFRRYGEASPQKYLMRLKANMAAHSLLTTDLSVKEIAYRLQFADQYVFSKAFKRTLGMPPRRCRHPASPAPRSRQTDTYQM